MIEADSSESPDTSLDVVFPPAGSGARRLFTYEIMLAELGDLIWRGTIKDSYIYPKFSCHSSSDRPGERNVHISQRVADLFEDPVVHFATLMNGLNLTWHPPYRQVVLHLRHDNPHFVAGLGRAPNPAWNSVRIALSHSMKKRFHVRFTDNCRIQHYRFTPEGLERAERDYIRWMLPKRIICVFISQERIGCERKCRWCRMRNRENSGTCVQVVHEMLAMRLANLPSPNSWMPYRCYNTHVVHSHVAGLYVGPVCSTDAACKIAEELGAETVIRFEPEKDIVNENGSLEELLDDGSELVTVGINLAGANDHWPAHVDWLIGVGGVLLSIGLPAYVVLWILDYFPASRHFTEPDKIDKLQAIVKSIRAVREARTDAKRRLEVIPGQLCLETMFAWAECEMNNK